MTCRNLFGGKSIYFDFFDFDFRLTAGFLVAGRLMLRFFLSGRTAATGATGSGVAATAGTYAGSDTTDTGTSCVGSDSKAP